MPTTPKVFNSCDCILKLNAKLLKMGYTFLPLVEDRIHRPALPGVVCFSKVLKASGSPSSQMVVSFNYCPFCGKQLRALPKILEEKNG